MKKPEDLIGCMLKFTCRNSLYKNSSINIDDMFLAIEVEHDEVVCDITGYDLGSNLFYNYTILSDQLTLLMEYNSVSFQDGDIKKTFEIIAK